MGLFNSEAPKDDSPDPMVESKHSMMDFERRISAVERSASDIERGIVARDEDINKYFEYVKYEIEAIRQENDSIKRELEEADTVMKQIIRNIRTLAQNKDIKDLNEMIRQMKLDGMISRNDYEAMVSDALKTKENTNKIM